jgi:phenylalanyl-tRNA synthetase beta chain
VGHPERVERSRALSDLVRDTMISLGSNEIITYSLISKDDLRFMGSLDDETIVAIQNPLSTVQEIMRPTLMPGALNTVAWNLNRDAQNMRLFEVGRVYHKAGKGFSETETLSLASVGESGGWLNRAGASFFDAKGALEVLFEKIGIKDAVFKGDGFPPFLSGEAASILVDGKNIGFLGKVDADVLDKFNIKTDVLLSEIDLAEAFKAADLTKKFREIPKFPSAKRDISIVIKSDIPHGDIVAAAREAGGELIAGIELFDQYFGAQIPHGSRSLSYAVEYRAEDRTLTDEEVNGLHTKVCDALVEKLGATIR